MIFGLPVVKCYSEALALLGDGLECLQQAAPGFFVGVAGVTKPGLKGEWVIRTAIWFSTGFFVAHDLVSELPA